MKITKELKTAVIVLGGILLFILGFTYLKSSSIFDKGRTYFAVYNDVGGITVGTPVTINGLNVGKVNDIRFHDSKGSLLVTMNVDGDFQFSENSLAEIYDTGIIGGKGVQIIPAFDGAVAAKSGDTLMSSIKPGLTDLVTQKLTPLQEKIEMVMESTDSVLNKVNLVLDEESRANLREVIANLNETVIDFRSASNKVNSILTNNKEILENTISNINHMSGNFSKISDTLAQANLGETIRELQATLGSFNQTLAEMEQGKGSLGKLIKDEELYKNLSEASGQLELLLEDMRLNPKRYVHFSLFGKKAAPYQPEEEPNND